MSPFTLFLDKITLHHVFIKSSSKKLLLQDSKYSNKPMLATSLVSAYSCGKSCLRLPLEQTENQVFMNVPSVLKKSLCQNKLLNWNLIILEANLKRSNLKKFAQVLWALKKKVGRKLLEIVFKLNIENVGQFLS